MPLQKLQFRPGINREITPYSNEGGWFDCDKVRFTKGFPEQIGGWARYSSSTFLGTCRSLFPWNSLVGDSYLGVGTHLKYYVNYGGAFYDITPIRATVSLSGPFSASNGSALLTITHAAHGANTNDFVTFVGATGLGGVVTADILNAEHQITAVLSDSQYQITLSVEANASDTGNGGSVDAVYQINVGYDTFANGSGWGAGGWGEDGWGEASTSALLLGSPRTWTQDNYGEDLLINIRDQGIYYWDFSAGLNARAVELSSLSGANSTPTIAKQILVSDRDRHILAFGCDPESNPGVQDPMIIRFSSQESLTDWESRATNTAGELRLGSGSEIVCAVETRQQILVFTDTTLYNIQFLGPPFTFGAVAISENTSILSPRVAVAVQDRVFWMGENGFYAYTGAVQKIPCSVRDYVFDDLNRTQSVKAFAGINSTHSEVWWFYPSVSGGGSVDKYVLYNYEENTWAYGSLSRTAWVDQSVFDYPISASSDGYLYQHEFGLNDGSQEPSVPISSYIESSPFDIGEGDRLMFVRRLLPDVSFMQSTEPTPAVDFTLSVRNYNDGVYHKVETQGYTYNPSATNDRSSQLYFRLRGRQMRVRIASDMRNVQWRLGSPRVDIQPDGGR